MYDEESAAEVGNGVAIFKLKKHEAVLWGQLHHPDSSRWFYYIFMVLFSIFQVF